MLKEEVGFEPTCPFLNNSLANCPLNRSSILPYRHTRIRTQIKTFGESYVNPLHYEPKLYTIGGIRNLTVLILSQVPPTSWATMAYFLNIAIDQLF